MGLVARPASPTQQGRGPRALLSAASASAADDRFVARHVSGPHWIGMATFHTRGSGGLSVAAGRGEQPRGRQAVALLTLSGNDGAQRTLGSQTVAPSASIKRRDQAYAQFCCRARAQAGFVLACADATVSIASERSAGRRAFVGANPVVSVHLCYPRQRTSEPLNRRRHGGRRAWLRAAPITACTARTMTDGWPLRDEGTS